MSDNLGSGVSRVLDPKQSGYTTVVWQQGRPPLDSEFNLISQVAQENSRQAALRGTPSGWYGDAINPQDSFLTDPSYSNWFKFGPQFSGEKQAITWANVNGWNIPVTGTLTGSPPGSPNDTDTWNRITLPPPSANTGDSRGDFVFLEVWQARIAPNPSTTNKPGSSAIYRFGNVEGGYSYINDDLQDPDIGFETTQRVQLQYRIRVISGLVGLASYPDGFDPSIVKGQGAAGSSTSYIFENMREELGDPGLWRAGDGSANALGTVDGYTYAIPLCVVFRRNTVIWDPSNLNGAVNRNPTAVDRTGYKTYSSTAVLSGNITSTDTSLNLVSVTNISLPVAPASPVLIKIGDEILSYTAITGNTLSGLVRGLNGSLAEVHKNGAVVSIHPIRPDGVFADQIMKNDILDLRHIVNPGVFDYQSLLQGGLDRVLKGNLRSSWKRTGAGPQGPWVTYLDLISASPGPLGTTQLDAPDGIRQIWSDASVIQPVVIPISSPASEGLAVSIGGTLGNTFTVTVENNGSPGVGFANGDTITIPKSQFVSTVPGYDVDQVSLIASTSYVAIRFMGETADLPTNQYSVSSMPNGDLTILFIGAFSGKTVGAFITMYVSYGPGRGLSHKPDAMHSVSYVTSSANLALQNQGVPSNNIPLRTTWAPLWAKFRNTLFNGQLPTTSEAYADPSSKTVVLTPYRLHTFSQVNPASTFLTIQKSPVNATTGAMPANTTGGNPKWGATDPLGLFSSYADPTVGTKSMVISVPRKLMPSFGEFYTPILATDSISVNQGINFGIYAPKGTVGAGVSNYIPMVNGSITYAVFSTTIAYNTAGTIIGRPTAGVRKFTDTRGLGRQGLELPPFYMGARIWAVYEALDYTTNSSAFDPSTRAPTVGGATNLLRQNIDGPTFWIEQDADGDPTFILSANAIDITKSPNFISSFDSGGYVIEASIFGADRGFGDFTQDCRIVLSRGRSEGVSGAGGSLSLPEFIVPGAPIAGNELAVTYSREPYQGDAWGSQTVYADQVYSPGPHTTATQYQLLNTSLDYANLSKPNPKVLEVLAGVSFQTTLGTGRLSGDLPANNDDFRVVNYEPWVIPSTPSDARPTITQNAFSAAERHLTVGTEYGGCVDRLPLGALFKSHNFRGNGTGGPSGDFRQLITGRWNSPSTFSGNTTSLPNSEFVTVPVHSSSMASGNAGEIVVQIDGNTGNYNILTNYRTTRGGSAFTSFGYVGGSLGAILPATVSATTSCGIMSGIALLVRNTPTSVGSVEVSAGQELMLLICTTSRAQGASGTVTTNSVQMNSSGTTEGYSASDLYRLPGHPLTNDSSRSTIDPLAVTLARKSNLL